MRRMLGLALLAVAAVMTGCGDSPETRHRSAGTAPATLEGSITVSAATSLSVAMAQIGAEFTEAHPGVRVNLNFDSSSTLAAQILGGAPADVFASADEATMSRLSEAGRIDRGPETFARNRLVIVTKPGNPEEIADLADLVDVGVVALCGEDAPCGRYAQHALDLAGVRIAESSVTRSPNAAATLTAVSDGDAVAAVVYATDALAARGSVRTVAIRPEVEVMADYPIATTVGSGDPDIASAFVDHVLGGQGQAVLSEHGFLPPS